MFGVCDFVFALLWHGIWYESIVWVIMGWLGVLSERRCYGCSSFCKLLHLFIISDNISGDICEDPSHLSVICYCILICQAWQPFKMSLISILGKIIYQLVSFASKTQLLTGNTSFVVIHLGFCHKLWNWGSLQYKDVVLSGEEFHLKDETVWQPFYLRNGNPNT